MTELSAFDAPTGQVPARSDQTPPATPEVPAPSLPTLPAQAAPPPGQPGLPSVSHHAPAGASPPAAATPSWKKPKRSGPVRLLIWAVVILALSATAVLAKRYWDSTQETASAPGSDQVDVAVDPTAQPSPVAAESTGSAGAVCAELQQVQALSNEVSLIMGSAVEEISASPGNMDETVVLARFQEAADLMDLSLPDLLASYESAARVAPSNVAADLRIVADGTALLTPAITGVMRNASAVEDLDGIERALEDPDLADAAIEAGNASLRLDEFTIPSCGFRFSN